jgi:xanthine dehydrogenase YagS FAD-binding subunit
MKRFQYATLSGVDEVISLLQGAGNGEAQALRPLSGVQPLAGGTDLLTLMKAGIASPSVLVNIKSVGDLERGIKVTDQGITLGALTTLTEIETSAEIRERYPALAEAAAVAATPQLRNMATIGGNLMQRPRCWYFRNSLFHCWLQGGEECHARDGQNQLHALFGDSPCVAVHPSDLAPALVALDARVTLRGHQGERIIPISEFFALPEERRRTETTIHGDELVLSIHLPTPVPGTRSTYLKAMDRKIWAFALVGVAAMVRTNGRRIEEARIVLGGVAPIPWRATAAEQALKGAEASDEAFARAASAALADARPLEHNAYKIPLAQSLIRRALQALTESAST